MRASLIAAGSLSVWSLACDATAVESFAAADCPSLAGAAADTGGGARPPAALADTGLYCDAARFATAPGVEAFRPAYEGWSDGADKTRWIQLPAGTRIDTSDPDNWSFPIGTRLWKEFKYAGKRVETRFIARVGAGSDDFVYAAYQWNADETAAELVPEVGAADVAPVASAPSAPLHDIPGTGTCKYCHGALPAHVLGIGTVQSSHEPGGLSLAELVAADRLTAAPAAPYEVPGNAVEQAALGYLHANCGHCHNDTDTGVTAPRFVLRLLVSDDTPAATQAYATAVNVLHTWLNAPPEAGDYRVRGGDPGSSELYFRTGVRAPGLQMPPVGSELADERGHAILKQWIEQLPAPD